MNKVLQLSKWKTKGNRVHMMKKKKAKRERVVRIRNKTLVMMSLVFLEVGHRLRKKMKLIRRRMFLEMKKTVGYP